MKSSESDKALEGFLWLIVLVTLDVKAALSRLRMLSSQSVKERGMNEARKGPLSDPKAPQIDPRAVERLV
jgi:hypothetical protein